MSITRYAETSGSSGKLPVPFRSSRRLSRAVPSLSHMRPSFIRSFHLSQSMILLHSINSYLIHLSQ